MRTIGLMIVLAGAFGCEADEDPAAQAAVDAAMADGSADGSALDAAMQDAAAADAAMDQGVPDRAVPPDMSGSELDMRADAAVMPDAAADMAMMPDAAMPDGAPDGAMPDGAMDDMAPQADAGVGVCVGPDPAIAPPFPERDGECISCAGSPPAEWALEDFQPQSCGLGETYGLNVFQGRVTLFATFNAGCGFCQAQAEGLERMRLELEFGGHEVWFVALNSASNVQHAERLIERCSYPLLQDTAEINAWGLQAGGVSDFYIYDAAGRLVRHYDQSIEREERGRSLTLSVEEDYTELKQALIDAIE